VEGRSAERSRSGRPLAADIQRPDPQPTGIQHLGKQLGFADRGRPHLRGASPRSAWPLLICCPTSMVTPNSIISALLPQLSSADVWSEALRLSVAVRLDPRPLRPSRDPTPHHRGTTDLQLLQDERVDAQLLGSRMQSTVQLIKALGGNWGR
jgi:hypothetical protein